MRKILLSIVVLAVALASCDSGAYKTTENGLKYKLHKANSSELRPELGDMFLIQLVVKTQNGEVLIDSRKDDGMPMYIFIEEPIYAGDFAEGFSMLSVGDSASFAVPADSLIKYRQLYIPDTLDTKQDIVFDVRVDSLITKSVMEAEKTKKREEMKLMEEEMIAQYVQENNITSEPNDMGLYIIPVKRGVGKPIQAGQKAAIRYIGSLLDGTVFDTNVEDVAKENNMYNPNRPYKLLEFVVGQGQVISGFDHGVASMRVGDKVKLIIPSMLGYGERGAGGVIEPYTPLVFEVELVQILD